MSITKLWIAEGCISCGMCQEICPEVFLVEETCEILPGADYDIYETQIREAAEDCPVDVILIENE